MLCVGFAFLTSLRNGCLHNSYGDFAPSQSDVVMFVLRAFITYFWPCGTGGTGFQSCSAKLRKKNMIEAKGLNMTQLFNYSYTIRMMILIATYWNYSSSHSHTMSWKYIDDYRWLWWLWCLVGVDSADWIQTCATFVSRSLCGSQREQLRELELERDALREEKPTETMVDRDDGDGINVCIIIYYDILPSGNLT